MTRDGYNADRVWADEVWPATPIEDLEAVERARAESVPWFWFGPVEMRANQLIVDLPYRERERVRAVVAGVYDRIPAAVYDEFVRDWVRRIREQDAARAMTPISLPEGGRWVPGPGFGRDPFDRVQARLDELAEDTGREAGLWARPAMDLKAIAVEVLAEHDRETGR